METHDVFILYSNHVCIVYIHDVRMIHAHCKHRDGHADLIDVHLVYIMDLTHVRVADNHHVVSICQTVYRSVDRSVGLCDGRSDFGSSDGWSGERTG